jgi:putative toxin-antitoxin system antitoxin component (TIGR02293 family)
MTAQSTPSTSTARTKARTAVWEFLQPDAKSKRQLSGIQIVVNQRVMAFNTETALGIIKNGISSRAIDPLSEFLGIGKGQVVEYLDLDRTTALRRATKDQPLPMHSAESVLRLLELDEIASDTFESEEAASGWLRRPHPMLEGESPLQAARTSFGAQRVKDILLAIKYGGVV